MTDAARKQNENGNVVKVGYMKINGKRITCSNFLKPKKFQKQKSTYTEK